MRRWSSACLSSVIVGLCCLPSDAWAQGTNTPSAPSPPTVVEQVEVVATRMPEAPQNVPAAIEVISGETLRNIGATSLREALSLATGVEIAAGQDGGPAGSVPEFWGLREFDAFLLVVDGVPWGGAFNPALTTLNLRDVERIEILRGPAPVTYGATSFVGVIHVVHTPAAARQSYASLRGGGFRTGSGSIDVALPDSGAWHSRLSVDAERQGFSDPRTSFARGHATYRGSKDADHRKMWFSADLNWLNEHPASPFPREGSALSTKVAIDSNFNPAGAFMHDRRLTAAFGTERPAMNGGQWATTVSFSHSSQDMFRGFLTDISNTVGNSSGLSEEISLSDLYVDSHVVTPTRSQVRWVFGGDFLHGQATNTGAVFKYTSPLSNASAPTAPQPAAPAVGGDDRREFGGGYAMVEWTAVPRVLVSAGVRLNMTFEEGGDAEPLPKPAGQKDTGVAHTRPSGSVGAIATLWEKGPDHVKIYGDYRDTFKPAAIDFGLSDTGEGGPLKPETSRDYEGGLKARAMNGRIDLEMELFRMDFTNLVTSATVGGLPMLTNSGAERFKGAEFATDMRLPNDVTFRATYSYHDARFTDFIKEFDPGVPTQLAGKRLEMSAHHLFSTGLIYGSDAGVVADVIVKYTGSRFLNQRNTAPAEAFTTLDAGIGYRAKRWEVRVDGRNLGNRRDPVSESELGDAQYYLMPARRADATVSFRF